MARPLPAGPVSAAIDRADPRTPLTRRLPDFLVMAVVVMAVVVAGLGFMIVLSEDTAHVHGPHWWALSPVVSLLLVAIAMNAARAWREESKTKAFQAWLASAHPDDASLARLTLSPEEDDFNKGLARRHLHQTRPDWRLALPTHPMPETAPSGLALPPYPERPVPWGKLGLAAVGAVALLVLGGALAIRAGIGHDWLGPLLVFGFYGWALAVCGAGLLVFGRIERQDQARFRASLASFAVPDLLYWQGSPAVAGYSRALIQQELTAREPGWSSRPDVPLWLLAYTAR